MFPAKQARNGPRNMRKWVIPLGALLSGVVEAAHTQDNYLAAVQLSGGQLLVAWHQAIQCMVGNPTCPLLHNAQGSRNGAFRGWVLFSTNRMYPVFAVNQDR